MSLTGWLAPLRDTIAAMWITEGGRNLDLLSALHLPDGSGLVFGLLITLLALELSRRNQIGWQRLVFASGLGFAVAFGWALTYALSLVSSTPCKSKARRSRAHPRTP